MRVPNSRGEGEPVKMRSIAVDLWGMQKDVLPANARAEQDATLALRRIGVSPVHNFFGRVFPRLYTRGNSDAVVTITSQRKIGVSVG